MLQPATVFLLLVAVPIARAAPAWVVGPLLRAPSADEAADSGRNDDARRQVNAAVIRERRAQLDRELAALPADSPERERLILAFSNAAMADLSPADGKVVSTGNPSRRWIPAAAMIGLMLAGPLVFYRLAGLPEISDPAFVRAASPSTIEELVAELERRLDRDPSSAEGWMLLGRTRLSMGQLPGAVAALERALSLDQPAARLDPQLAAQIRVDLADAVAQSSERRLAGRPWALIQEALQRDPNHPKALALAGAYAVSRNDTPAALGYWQTLLAQLPADSDQHRQIAGFIAELQSGRRPGAAPGPGPVAGTSTGADPGAAPRAAPSGNAPAAGPTPQGASAPGPVLQGTVTLDERLAARASPEDTLFVVVRGVGPDGQPAGPPAAVARVRVADLPWRFAFSDRDAMSPMARLSGQQRVIVVARISRAGTATAAPGDLEGRSGVVEPTAEGVAVRIEREL